MSLYERTKKKMDKLDVKNVLEFIKLVHVLKHTRRTGWEYCNVPNSERIAGHMYSMGMMTFLIDDKSNLDRLKCLQLAVVHDLAECIVGDLTPRDNVSAEEKYKREEEAMKEIGKLVGEEIGSLLYNLWLEYEEKSTPEAIFVKDLDRFDLVFTAAHYEKTVKDAINIQEFYDNTLGKFEHPFVKKLVDEVMHERESNLKKQQNK